MKAWDMFYDPSKSALQMVHLLKYACVWRCESYEFDANEIKTQNTGH